MFCQFSIQQSFRFGAFFFLFFSEENLLIHVDFLLFKENIFCGYSLEAPWREVPRRGTSNEYSTHNIFVIRKIEQYYLDTPLICSYVFSAVKSSIHVDIRVY